MWYTNLPWDNLFLICIKPKNLSSHQIFANPGFQSKRKRHATPIGAGYTEYQPESIFLDLFRGKNGFFVEPILKPQDIKVLLNFHSQPKDCSGKQDKVFN